MLHKFSKCSPKIAFITPVNAWKMRPIAFIKVFQVVSIFDEFTNTIAYRFGTNLNACSVHVLS